MDTSYLEVDVQPLYVRVTIKSKILQLTLSSEVLTEKSLVQRNTTTGHLIITMPRLNPSNTICGKKSNKTDVNIDKESSKVIKKIGPVITKRELLEIGPPKDDLDFSKIAINSRNKKSSTHLPKLQTPPNFIDNPQVPPLE